MSQQWKQCSSCKKPIDFGQKYWECSVSTCNRSRNPLFFCSVACWDAHVPLLRHRDAWAIERRAPSFEEHQELLNKASEKPPAAPSNNSTDPVAQADLGFADAPLETLVVMSQVKDYLQAHELGPHKELMAALSDRVRELCERASLNARRDERKTLMERDFSKARQAPKTKTLIVASRLKRFVKARTGLNTSNGVIGLLSEHVALMLHQGVRAANDEGRAFVTPQHLDG